MYENYANRLGSGLQSIADYERAEKQRICDEMDRKAAAGCQMAEGPSRGPGPLPQALQGLTSRLSDLEHAIERLHGELAPVMSSQPTPVGTQSNPVCSGSSEMVEMLRAQAHRIEAAIARVNLMRSLLEL